MVGWFQRAHKLLSSSSCFLVLVYCSTASELLLFRAVGGRNFPKLLRLKQFPRKKGSLVCPVPKFFSKNGGLYARKVNIMTVGTSRFIYSFTVIIHHSQWSSLIQRCMHHASCMTPNTYEVVVNNYITVNNPTISVMLHVLINSEEKWHVLQLILAKSITTIFLIIINFIIHWLPWACDDDPKTWKMLRGLP